MKKTWIPIKSVALFTKKNPFGNLCKITEIILLTFYFNFVLTVVQNFTKFNRAV